MQTAQVTFWVVAMLVMLALAFDFMNGFHDAANSIATVVSTGVLKPQQAILFAAFSAVIGMLAGLIVCMYYMYITYDFFGGVAANEWFAIKPIAAGVFGMPAGLLGVILGSLVSRAPSIEIQQLVDHVRYPNLAGDIDTRAA